MIQLIQLKSSNLKAAGHDPSSNTLAVQFTSGTVYHYKDVPADVASKLMQAESAGSFFAKNIRGQYPHEAVVDEPAQA